MEATLWLGNELLRKYLQKVKMPGTQHGILDLKKMLMRALRTVTSYWTVISYWNGRKGDAGMQWHNI